MANSESGFSRDNGPGCILLEWWQPPADGKPGGISNGDRAALKRCATTTDVVFVPAYQTLFRRLAPLLGCDRDSYQAEKLARISGLLAHVRVDVPDTKLPEQMAIPDGNKPTVSELRFQRLIRQEDNEQLYRDFIRVIQLLDRKLDVINLANSIWFWGDKLRRDWVYAYYDKAPPRETAA
jgi:CRISPR system Cascade subunit CasB